MLKNLNKSAFENGHHRRPIVVRRCLAIGYPIAGFTGTYFKNSEFLIGGLLTLGLLAVVVLLSKIKNAAS